MMNQGDLPKEEKMRSCPTCRMEIPVLATKCRYCGEPVGRPRDENRNLTVVDLGGETIRHYAPSSNVMDALESFRAEESQINVLPKEEAGKTLFGVRRSKNTKPDATPSSSFGLPQLDDQSQMLADAVLQPKKRKANTAKGSAWADRIKTIGIGAGALAGAAVLLLYVVPFAMSLFEKESTIETFHSRAPALIEQGAPAVQVLEAAVEALLHDDGDTNRQTARKARDMVKQEVEKLLNAKQWSMETLDQASALASRAAEVDSNPATQAVKQEVAAETLAYSIVYLGAKTDGGAKTATFKVTTGPGKTEDISAAEGDVIRDRFVVKSITNDYGRLEDKLRSGRLVAIYVSGGIKQL